MHIVDCSNLACGYRLIECRYIVAVCLGIVGCCVGLVHKLPKVHIGLVAGVVPVGHLPRGFKPRENLRIRCCLVLCHIRPFNYSRGRKCESRFEFNDNRLFLAVLGKCRFEECSELADDLLNVVALNRRLGRAEFAESDGLDGTCLKYLASSLAEFGLAGSRPAGSAPRATRADCASSSVSWASVVHMGK